MASGKRHSKRNRTLAGPARNSDARSLWLPFAFSLGLLLVSLTPRAQSSRALAASISISALGLIGWQAALWLWTRRTDRNQSLKLALRPHHYVQAIVQASVFLYWGYYWRTVYEHFWLIVAQILFAYCFDILLHWTRGRTYFLGFGPFPIIFSINLFLWFRDDWFYLQFLLIAVGFMGKSFVGWQRDGRRAHVFNPSAFALGIFATLLIATGTTDLTWGQEIASTLTLAPYIYTFLFLTGLVVMYVFSITLVAGTAAVTLFGLSALYGAAAGVPYFVDSEIPAAVFLGLHLLITDPSTSPRTAGGKAIFGGLYGLGVFGLYALLGHFGAPTFYDKLLCVPLLNLSVRGIDRLVDRVSETSVPRWLPQRLLPRSNLAYMTVWIAVFSVATVAGGTDGRHRGDSLPFWQQACEDGRRGACDQLMELEATYCGDASAWACNELGIQYLEGRMLTPDRGLALSYFSRSCELRFQAGCLNLLNPASIVRGPPHELDLRLLLREGGLNLMDMPERELYARACRHRWIFACEQIGAAP